MAATDPAADLEVTPEQVVAHEARLRPRVGLIALAGAIFTVLANVVQNTTLADGPKVTEIDALREAAGEPIGRTGLASAQALYLNDHAAGLLLSIVLQSLVYVGLGLVLLQLLRMTLDRGGRVARPTRYLVYIGATLASVGGLARIIGLLTNASDFAASKDQGTQAAHDVTTSGGLLVGGTLVGQLGIFAMAAAIVLVALAAMRVGLLTRFVGVLGAIVGVLQILGPLSQASFIVTAFWLAMIGALMLGRWPSGMPPAWAAGAAVPWPSQQEIREQREHARGGRGGGGGTANGTPATVTGPVSDGPSPSTAARKKRKRRG
ncbi:hypothetical protein DSM104299_00718 [Baekduia alba]|uniref:hypothetical protein n=1 Tax=Baekduia alba TaxID=2997333 RepID=UPI0023400F52|nr:hypothetical protein [Baekduia alba]WCB92037.1 hypothetical protein DSM104299_00718 [Baekduia alba]